MLLHILEDKMLLFYSTGSCTKLSFSTLNFDLLEAIMLVSINGPVASSKEESQIIDRAVKQWNQLPRRKLPKVQHSTPMHVTSVTTSDAQVN